MKILFLTENYWIGGLDTFLITLINNWPHSEDELALICNKSHPGLMVIQSRLKRPCKIKPHNLPTLPNWERLILKKKFFGRWLSIILTILGKVLGYPVFIFHILYFVHKFRALGYERLMVVNGGYPGGWTCRAASIAWGLAGLKPYSIHNFHNFAVRSSKLRGWIEYSIDIAVRHFSRAIVSVSKTCLASLNNRTAFQKTGNYRVIYNGIDSNMLSNKPDPNVRQELGIPKDSPLCLMLASYDQRKGHDLFLKAFKQVNKNLPDLRALICGYGTLSEVEHVKRIITSLSLDEYVNCEGYRKDTDALLREAQVLVVPSQSYESFGLVIVEAMAMRVPVVATRVGGIPEAISNGQGGFLVDPDDINGFAGHIKIIIEDSALRAEVGELGFKQYATKFTSDRMALEYADLIRSAS